MRYVESKKAVGKRNLITFNSSTGRITVKYISDEDKTNLLNIAEYIKNEFPNFKYTMRAHVTDVRPIMFKSENDTLTYVLNWN